MTETTNYSMSWMLKYRKYKKKVKQLLFARSELEYQETVLKDAHHDFEEYYLRFCAEKGIDLQNIKTGKEQKIDNIFLQTETDKNALIHHPGDKQTTNTKVFNWIYKEVAKKVHPDKLSIFLPEDEIKEKENLFKQASSAMDKCDWGKLLEVADRLNIKPKTFEGMDEQISIEIEKINKIISYNENTYSWIWVNCESEGCKEEVVKNFLHHLFDYKSN